MAYLTIRDHFANTDRGMFKTGQIVVLTDGLEELRLQRFYTGAKGDVQKYAEAASRLIGVPLVDEETGQTIPSGTT